jgi:outer membrane protein TolC
MRTSSLPAVLVVVLVLLGSGGARAVRAQTPVPLSLAEAIARGLETSHRLAEIDARRDAARAVAAAREAADAPLVSLQGGYSRTNHVTEFSVPGPAGGTRVLYPDVPDNLRSRVDLQWPIYTGGRIDALERAARAEADAIGEDRAAAQADLTLEITRAFWAVVTARSAAEVLEQALARTDAHLADVRNRLAVGLVPPNEVLSAEAQRFRQELLLIEASNQGEASAAELRRLTGLDPDAAVEIDEPLAPPPPPAATAAAAIEQARVDRPERRALAIRIDQARAREAAAEAGRRPALAVTGGYDYARPNPRIFPRAAEWQTSWDVGLNLSWSLWDGGRVRADVTEAAANRRALEERRLEFDARLAAEIRLGRLDLASARAAITASDAAVRSAAEARRVVSDRFDAGVATNTDVIDAQLLLLQAELDRTRALANARLAAARLDRALGR